MNGAAWYDRRVHEPKARRAVPGKAAQYAALSRPAAPSGASSASYRVSTTFWRSICSEQKRTVDLQWGQQMESGPETAIRRFGLPPGKRAF